MIKVARERTVRVRDVMAMDLFVIPVGTSRMEAAAMLAQRRVGGAPVVSRSGKPVGIVSRADLLDPRHQGEDVLVEHAMTRVLYAVKPSDPLMAAVRLMASEKIHRVLVTDEHGHLVGLVSTMDVLRALAESEPEHDVPLEYVKLGAHA